MVDHLFERAEIIHAEDTITRMFHLDAGRQYKLRGLMQCAMGAAMDGWRLRFDMESLIGRGVWPFMAYVRVDVAPVALAAGRPGKVTTAVAGGRISAELRGEGSVMMGTELAVHGLVSGERTADFMSVGEGAKLEPAGRIRGLWALVKPFAPPEERVLREVPEELAQLRMVDCGLPPSIRELSELPGYEEPAQGHASARAIWGAHHTDANQIVFTAEYLGAAEDMAAQLAHACGMAGNAFRMDRAEMVFKAPAFAGQAYELRGRLLTSSAEQRTVALCAFHPVDAEGKAGERPAAFVRLEAPLPN